MAETNHFDTQQQSHPLWRSTPSGMTWFGRGHRLLARMMSAIGLLLAIAPTASADPYDNHDPYAPSPPSPYPSTQLILTTYQRVDPSQFFMPTNYGVYFMSPTGLNCAIWDKGNFNCGGFLPGAPPGTDHIGWFNGDTTVHYDLMAAIQTPPVQAQSVLPPSSYVNWNETMCATMADSSTYCKRGEFRFFITANGTYLSPSYAPATW